MDKKHAVESRKGGEVGRHGGCASAVATAMNVPETAVWQVAWDRRWMENSQKASDGERPQVHHPRCFLDRQWEGYK